MTKKWYLTSEGWFSLALEYERQGRLIHASLALVTAITFEQHPCAPRGWDCIEGGLEVVQ